MGLEALAGIEPIINFVGQAGTEVANWFGRKQQWKREDTAIQRRMADMKRAGLNAAHLTLVPVVIVNEYSSVHKTVSDSIVLVSGTFTPLTTGRNGSMCAIRNGTLRICFERLVNPRGAGRRGYTRATLARRRTGRRR